MQPNDGVLKHVIDLFPSLQMREISNKSNYVTTGVTSLLTFLPQDGWTCASNKDGERRLPDGDP